MNYITSELDLDQEIIRLETKSKVQEEVLKDNILSMFNKEKITEYLKDGCMPLEILEKSMDEWAKKQ